MLLIESPFLNGMCIHVADSVFWHGPGASDCRLCSLHSVLSLWTKSTWTVPMRLPERLWSTLLPPQRVFSTTLFSDELSDLFSWMQHQLQAAESDRTSSCFDRLCVLLSDEYGKPFNHEESRNLKDQTKPKLKSLRMKQLKRSVLCSPLVCK